MEVSVALKPAPVAVNVSLFSQVLHQTSDYRPDTGSMFLILLEETRIWVCYWADQFQLQRFDLLSGWMRSGALSEKPCCCEEIIAG